MGPWKMPFPDPCQLPRQVTRLGTTHPSPSPRTRRKGSQTSSSSNHSSSTTKPPSFRSQRCHAIFRRFQKAEEPVVEPKRKSRPIPEASMLRINAGTRVEIPKTFEQVYKRHEELGSGAFATVYRVEHRETGAVYAAKVIDKKVTADDDRIAEELAILEKVRHPYVIELVEVFETQEHLYVITELVTGGELFDRIVQKGTFTERDAADLIRKVVEGLAYLHDMDIIHRDLKPENLLLKSKDNDTEVKIADFGLAKVLGAAAMTQTACGTPSYVAPEVLKSDNGYDTAVDMWSVGVITYILLSGFPPFYNQNMPLLFESILLCDFDYPAAYFDHISDDAIDFIDALLIAQPAQRLSAKQALKHPWLTSAPTTRLDVSRSLKNFQGIQKKMK